MIRFHTLARAGAFTLLSLGVNAETPTALNETAQLIAEDGAPGDALARSVGISGSTAIAGAPHDDENGYRSGSAYLIDTLTGLQLAKLLPADGNAEDAFGTSVAISGAYAVVGVPYDDGNGHGPDSGSIYVFDTTTGTQLFKLVPSDGATEEYFGASVAISGTTVIVGAHGAGKKNKSPGAAYLFDVTTGVQLAKLLATDGEPEDEFGLAVAIHGTTAIVGARFDSDNGLRSGSAYLFDVTTGLQTFKLQDANGSSWDWFGTSVAIRGTTAVVGVPGADDNGFAAGSAFVFDALTGLQTTKLLAEDGQLADHFGGSVAISGTNAIVGASGTDDQGLDSGSAYYFDLSSGSQLAKLLISDGAQSDFFGTSIASDGTPTTIIGAPYHAGNTPGTGAVISFGFEPLNYCTAGTSASGCQATLAASGIPSASAANGFTLSATNAEGVTRGLFFFGTNGRQALPWGSGSGFQCVVPPVQRVPVPLSGGTAGACDGVFSQDLNDYWRAGSHRNPGAGAIVQAQLWYRGPFSHGLPPASLSDAIEFWVTP